MEELETHAWCRSTGGALSASQRRSLLVAVLAEYPALVADLARLVTGLGQPADTRWSPPVVAADVEEAVLSVVRRQGPSLLGHGLRTWQLGSALASSHGVEVDADELFVAAAAHDVGLAAPVPGQDFTVRSADVAVEAWTAAFGAPSASVATRLRDAVVAHATPGVDAARSPLGWAVQAGATADLVGRRLADLPADVVDEVYRRHPQDGMRRVLAGAIRDEARAVPAGRFALLRRTGFVPAVQAAPHRTR